MVRDESTSTVPVYTSIVVVSTECANVVVLHDVKACVLLWTLQGDDDDSIDYYYDDDDDDAELRGLRMDYDGRRRAGEAEDADAGGYCNLTVPAVGITVTVSPPSPDCSPGHLPAPAPAQDDHLTGRPMYFFNPIRRQTLHHQTPSFVHTPSLGHSLCYVPHSSPTVAGISTSDPRGLDRLLTFSCCRFAVATIIEHARGWF